MEDEASWLTHNLSTHFTLLSRSSCTLLFPAASSWLALTYYSRFQVNHDSPGHVLPIASLTEKGGEGVVIVDLAGLSAKRSISLDAVFQTEEFPAGIANLNSSLTHMD